MVYKDLNGKEVTAKEIEDDIELAEFLESECKSDKSVDVLKELQEIRGKYSYFFEGEGRNAYYAIDNIVGKHLGLELMYRGNHQYRL